MFMKRNNKRNIKYDIARNNYVGLLFFACVLASLLYIIKTQTPVFQELKPTQKEILTPETEILKPNDEINKLMNYLNQSDINTFKIYKNSYIYNESVSNKNINKGKTSNYTNFVCDKRHMFFLLHINQLIPYIGGETECQHLTS